MLVETKNIEGQENCVIMRIANKPNGYQNEICENRSAKITLYLLYQYVRSKILNIIKHCIG